MIDYYTLQILAQCGYPDKNDLPLDWRQLGKTYTNSQSGFTGKVFINDDNEIVISYSGTNVKQKEDISNDLNMAIGNLPPQAENAMELYNKVKRDYPNAKITLTGHSLGGSLDQIVAKKTGATAVAFSPFSTKDDGKEYPNITNIGDSQDFIFMSDINTQPGKVMIAPNDSGKIVMPRFNIFPEHYKLENLCLLELKNYKKKSLESFFDKMNNGENHQGLKNVQASVKKIYDAYDKFKKPQMGNDESYNHNNKRLYGHVANPSAGHWVTINGNHLLLPD